MLLANKVHITFMCLTDHNLEFKNHNVAIILIRP
jgi:hypothetical protein